MAVIFQNGILRLKFSKIYHIVLCLESFQCDFTHTIVIPSLVIQRVKNGGHFPKIFKLQHVWCRQNKHMDHWVFYFKVFLQNNTASTQLQYGGA